MKSIEFSEPLPEDHQILKELFFNKGPNSQFSHNDTLIIFPSEDVHPKMQ